VSDPKDNLVAAMANIAMHPETHQQAAWRCGTGMCIAGHVAEVANEVEWMTMKDSNLESYSMEMVEVKATGEVVHVSHWAQNHLGLSGEAREILFHGNRTRDELEGLVNAYKNGEEITFQVLDRVQDDILEG